MRSWETLINPDEDIYRPPDARLNTKGARYISKILRSVTEEVEVEEYVQKLRVSSLPICGLVDAVARLEKPGREIPYSMDFYTSIGTAVHETIQQRMTRSKKYGKIVYGRFECRESEGGCGYTSKIRLRPASLICPKCQSARLFYKEIAFDIHGVSGHLDMLTLDAHGNFVAWEFKTTNEYSINNPGMYLPYKKHHMQIQTYCMMLWKLYGIKVKMYTICYISRNKARDTNNPFSLDQFVTFAFKMTPAIRAMRLAEIVKIEAQDVAIKKLFAKPTAKNLKTLEDLRPCKSKADYHNDDTGMTHAFFGKKTCPYLSKGLCFHQHLHRSEAGMILATKLGI
jgi:hypothetical protein